MRVVALVITLAATVAVAKPALDALPNYTFEEFLKEYKKSYADSKEYNLRKTLFETRVAGFVKHNFGPHSYKLNVNRMADMSNEEIKGFNGYNKKAARSFRARANFTVSTAHYSGEFPDSLDWRTSHCVTPVKDQAACGSCWAFGSAETLESHTCLHGKAKNLPVLAPQQLVDCAPNPDHCGGTGGCGGSIPELAYDWVKGNGMASEADYPYTGRDGHCKKTAPTATCTGYQVATSNNYTAVMAALQFGPLAVSVAAGPWQFYDSGVFTDCPTDNIDIDHVVQLVGYGKAANGKDYWLIRNSWNEGWGEKGYIRLERHANSDFCGMDNTPADGTGCTGGPPSVKVCGSCGVLYDAVWPTVA